MCRPTTAIIRGVWCWLSLGFVAVPYAGAYINAGFRSQGEYNRYLRYEKQVRTKIAPYSAAIHRNPNDAVSYYQRARAWDQLPVYNGPWPENQPEKGLDARYQALKDYDQAIALDPSFGRAYLWRAGSLWYHGIYGKAVQDLEKAIRLEPKWPLARAFLASVRTACPDEEYRDQAAARKQAEQACTATGYTDPASLEVLAAVCAQDGDFARAVKWQTKAVKLLKDSVPGYDARQRLRVYEKRRKNPYPLTLRELEQASKDPRPAKK